MLSKWLLPKSLEREEEEENIHVHDTVTWVNIVGNVTSKDIVIY